ncbi:DUF3307 domain-containing protein [Dokdonia genika]|uniref:DUF3307 domain-containing protein n=1 Tax=Dokdonia genika TaxID=308113 RepID=A0ABV9LBB0_9FLAO
MEIITLITLQTIAHLLADYTFQSKKTAKSKAKKGFKSKYLKWHILIVFVCSYLLSFDYRFLPVALIIAGLHWVIDGFKPQMLASKRLYKGAFFIDQLLHILIYALVSTAFVQLLQWQPILIDTLHLKYISLVAAFLFCTKPANILIKEIFTLFSVSFTEKSQDLPNAGRLIGITERWLVLVLIIIGQFSAVGFLITAKSILRFKDGDYLKTEYVLIGTMLSFAIAIASALILTLFIFPLLPR